MKEECTRECILKQLMEKFLVAINNLPNSRRTVKLPSVMDLDLLDYNYRPDQLLAEHIRIAVKQALALKPS